MKRTIRDIKIKKSPRSSARATGATSRERNVSASQQNESNEEPVFTEKKTSSSRRRRNSRRGGGGGGRGALWLIAFVILIVLGMWVAGRFHRATVTITPEQTQVPVGLTVTAEREPGNNELRFDIMSTEESLSTTVPAGATEFVERRASGQIVIFNEESSSQDLREETRFETPDGLIFKLGKGEGVTVPGARGETPGQVEVTVYADEPGEEYNIGLTDFVIPGWREIQSPKFETQYARSQTEMRGGFSGEEASVDPETEQSALDELRAQLNERLLSTGIAQAPDHMIVLREGIRVMFDDPERALTNDGSVEITQTGRMTAMMFDERELATYLAERSWDEYDGLPVLISNLEEIVFEVPESATLTPDTSAIDVTVSGPLNFTADIDADALQTVLAGTAGNEFQDAMSEIPGIARAERRVRPFWIGRMPDDEERISVRILPGS